MKQLLAQVVPGLEPSLPLRERGLKLVLYSLLNQHTLSLPLRERGLKLMSINTRIKPLSVAPPAGAWIETKRGFIDAAEGCVAPPAGAWIETGVFCIFLISTAAGRSPCGSVD